MTPKQLRALDVLVATHVMGLRVVGEASVTREGGRWMICGRNHPDAIYEDHPLYVHPEWMTRKHPQGRPLVHGYPFSQLEVVPFYSADIRAAWTVVDRFTDVCIEKAGDGYSAMVSGWAWGEHANAPVAICLAALLASGVPQSDIDAALTNPPAGTSPEQEPKP